ncbi:MAG: bactofilin family protein [Janthinobacterium lividum]
MLRSETLFGKRETPTPAPSATPPLSATGVPPISSPKSTLSNHSLNNTMNPTAAPAPVSTEPSSTNEMGSKLIVGPNIKLKGAEITDCDTLVVEGYVEATMDSRVIQIADGGEFKGSVEVDFAEIHGTFNGELTVREKLIIHASGHVTGKIRYGKLVINEGGQLSGDVQMVSGPSSKGLSVAKPVQNVSQAVG